jgi:hypothetical protein
MICVEKEYGLHNIVLLGPHWLQLLLLAVGGKELLPCFLAPYPRAWTLMCVMIHP